MPKYNIPALLFAVFYLLTVTKPVYPVLHYTANYGVYVNELCENKDKPEMACNGTCILAQKLNAAKKETKKPAIPVMEGLDWYMSLLDDDHFAYHHSYTTETSYLYLQKVSLIFLDQPTPPPIDIG